MDIEIIANFLRDNMGDLTFKEAYEKTGWILNISVTGHGKYDQSKLFNYLNAPNVVIWSAACASCCLPFAYGPPVELMYKTKEGELKPYHLTN